MRHTAITVWFVLLNSIAVSAFVPMSRNTALVEQRISSDWRRHAEKPTAPTDNRREVIIEEASQKLDAAGWSMPTAGDLTSEDPFVVAIDAGIQRDIGVPLDELLNPAKVVNLERDLYELRRELAASTGIQLASDDGGEIKFSITEECDGGGGGPETDQLRAQIAKKEKDLAMERRTVFQGWLKNVFVAQAVLSFGLSYVMATNPSSLFGQFGWFYVYNMDISIQVLGYWWWWLFVVPSLRSRRPKGLEKKALDWAFLATPLISILAPVATKDTGLIWGANFAVVASCYAAAFLIPEGDGDGEDDDANTPEWLKFAYKSLDFGSGRERGARK
eukprot:CAMPEP_0198149606 /NCGR_PEP_ID=MMETSP1443-20131203/47394_1 /TAXON_ID=186043 /ORGANISM="Entomoneis sp., Strain CCMP2396" /LENGTH=331 /DNA_ID=CAMNT_0043814693 /DNA_START=67 /DNA_END=1062 /DNA_ORIENTATION=-